MYHPEINNQKIVDKVVARRGTLHAFNNIDPSKTALVVIDLMLASVQDDERCLDMIPAINSLASTLRKAGGTVESEYVQKNT